MEDGLLVGGLEHDFYDFPYTGNNDANWLIFFRGVETTNQSMDSLLFFFYSYLQFPERSQLRLNQPKMGFY